MTKEEIIEASIDDCKRDFWWFRIVPRWFSRIAVTNVYEKAEAERRYLEWKNRLK